MHEIGGRSELAGSALAILAGASRRILAELAAGSPGAGAAVEAARRLGLLDHRARRLAEDALAFEEIARALPVVVDGLAGRADVSIEDWREGGGEAWDERFRAWRIRFEGDEALGRLDDGSDEGAAGAALRAAARALEGARDESLSTLFLGGRPEPAARVAEAIRLAGSIGEPRDHGERIR